MVGLVLIISTCIVIVIVCTASWYFLQFLRGASERPATLLKKNKPAPKNPPRTNPTPKNPPQTSPASKNPLRTKLVKLCYGDHALADRLYLAAKRPGKSAKWIYEKAIDDLIRDRSR